MKCFLTIYWNRKRAGFWKQVTNSLPNSKLVRKKTQYKSFWQMSHKSRLVCNKIYLSFSLLNELQQLEIHLTSKMRVPWFPTFIEGFSVHLHSNLKCSAKDYITHKSVCISRTKRLDKSNLHLFGIENV